MSSQSRNLKDLSTIAVHEEQRFYRFKEAFVGLTDRDLNEATDALSVLSDTDLTLRRVFLAAFRSKPKLLLLIPRAFG